MIEFLAVCLTWASKWYKSGATRRSRRLGFWLSVLVSVVWVGFFIHHEQYWLSLNSVVTLFICYRGLKNNKKRNDDD